jgi:hypothetical protein
VTGDQIAKFRRPIAYGSWLSNGTKAYFTPTRNKPSDYSLVLLRLSLNENSSGKGEGGV